MRTWFASASVYVTMEINHNRCTGRYLSALDQNVCENATGVRLRSHKFYNDWVSCHFLTYITDISSLGFFVHFMQYTFIDATGYFTYCFWYIMYIKRDLGQMNNRRMDEHLFTKHFIDYNISLLRDMVSS